MPCNLNQRRLAEFVKAGIRAAGGTPMEFNTISAQRRRVDGHRGDEGVARSAARSSPTRSSSSSAATCSTASSASSAATRRSRARRWRWAASTSRGSSSTTARSTRARTRAATSRSCRSSRRSAPTGRARSALDELYEIESAACPGAGRLRRPVHGQHDEHGDGVHRASRRRASTASRPRTRTRTRRPAATGELVMDLVRDDVRPSSHRDPAGARERDRLGGGDRRLDQRRAAPPGDRPRVRASRSTSTSSATIADRTPLIADMLPGGRFTAADMYDAGGVGLVMRELLKRRPAPRRCEPTVDGRTIAEIAAARVETPGPDRSWCRSRRPLKPTGGLAILRGSLAPEGCVVKLAGHERRLSSGSGPRLRLRGRLLRGGQGSQRIMPGDVVVIRYEGPVGGPGMQEMLQVTAALVGRGPRRVGRRC